MSLARISHCDKCLTLSIHKYQHVDSCATSLWHRGLPTVGLYIEVNFKELHVTRVGGKINRLQEFYGTFKGAECIVIIWNRRFSS